jgi:hypothetical protein
MLIGRVLPLFAIWSHQYHDAVSAGYSRAPDCSVHRSKMRMVSFQEYDCVVADDEQLGVEDEITSSSNPVGEPFERPSASRSQQTSSPRDGRELFS